jgi:hypothetical protein
MERMTSTLDSIARLHRLASALKDGDDDARWLADRLQNYFDAAPRGLTLDLAFDLSPAPGQVSWWTARAIEARDSALRELAARFYSGRKPASQAYQIERQALRYAASTWRFDRERPDMPKEYTDTAAESLWWAFKSGATMPLSKRQLQSILGESKRDEAA